MGKDVFISYSSADKQVATGICSALELAGTPCWIAPRDILPGTTYADALIQAIDASRIMVLVYSSMANTSPHILREVERAVHNNIPIIPFRLDNSNPSNAMLYYISTPHWLDASEPPLEKNLDLLVKTVHAHLTAKPGEDVRSPETPLYIPPSGIQEAEFLHSIRSAKKTWILSAVAILCVVIIGSAILLTMPPSPSASHTPVLDTIVPTQQPVNNSGSGQTTPVVSPVLSSGSGQTTPAVSTVIPGGRSMRIVSDGVAQVLTNGMCGTSVNSIPRGSGICIVGLINSPNVQSETIRAAICNADCCSAGGAITVDQFVVTTDGTPSQTFSHVLDIDTNTLPLSTPLCLKVGIPGTQGSGQQTKFSVVPS
jgi:hypothetical protein